jgi:hypothetical protein
LTREPNGYTCEIVEAVAVIGRGSCYAGAAPGMIGACLGHER